MPEGNVNAEKAKETTRAREAKLKKQAILCYIAAAVIFGLLSAAVVIALVEDAVSAEEVWSKAGHPETHTVKKEDTWETISNMLGIKASELQEANPGIEIGKEFTASIGITITIPSSAEAYTIKSGDTLKDIADEKKVSLARLTNRNEEYIEEAKKKEDAEGNTGFPLIAGDELVIPPPDPVKDRIPGCSIGFAALFVVALGLVILGFQRRADKNLPDIVKGDAGRYSISKLQMLLWTGCFIFTFFVVLVSRVLNGNGFVTELPEALLALMGISVTTFASAKAIVQGQQPPQEISPEAAAKNEETRPTGTEESKGGADLILDSQGNTDISRLQLLAWTIIGVGLYLFEVFTLLKTTNGVGMEIPDVNGTILALTIASSGGYLSKRLVWRKPKSPVVRVELVEQPKGEQRLFLYGVNFGLYSSDTGKNKIEIRKTEDDDFAPLNYDDTAKDWTDTLLRGKAALGEPALKAGDYIRVKVRLGGIDYPETTFKVFARRPSVHSIEPNEGKQGEVTVKISGKNFESPKVVKLVRGSEEMVGTDIDQERTTATEIHCKIQIDKQPDGKWSLVVVNADGGQAWLDDAFTVKL